MSSLIHMLFYILFLFIPILILWSVYFTAKKDKDTILIQSSMRTIKISSSVAIFFTCGIVFWRLSYTFFSFADPPKKHIELIVCNALLHIFVWFFVAPPLMKFRGNRSRSGKKLFSASKFKVRKATLKPRKEYKALSLPTLLLPYIIAAYALSYIIIRISTSTEPALDIASEVRDISYTLFILIGCGFILYYMPLHRLPIPGEGEEAKKFTREQDSLMNKRMRLTHGLQTVLTSCYLLHIIFSIESKLDVFPHMVALIISASIIPIALVFVLYFAHKTGYLIADQTKLEKKLPND